MKKLTAAVVGFGGRGNAYARYAQNHPEELQIVAVAEPNQETKLFKGWCSGRILTEVRGESGFGYDPVFYKEELGKTLAEMTAEEKNSISHRGDALKRMTEAI